MTALALDAAPWVALAVILTIVIPVAALVWEDTAPVRAHNRAMRRLAADREKNMAHLERMPWETAA